MLLRPRTQSAASRRATYTKFPTVPKNLVDCGKRTVDATTDHIGGCAWDYNLGSLSKTLQECQLAWEDLATLGLAEVTIENLQGCFNQDPAACMRAWLDLLTFGVGTSAICRNATVAERTVGTAESVSARVAAHLSAVKSIAADHGLTLPEFGDGYLWANKEANLALHTPEQVAAVQERGFTQAELTSIRDYYRAVDEASGGANPSASYRADLMQYYLDNWGR